MCFRIMVFIMISFYIFIAALPTAVLYIYGCINIHQIDFIIIGYFRTVTYH